MEKFMIIDGNSILNRAYYAIRLLTTKDGRPTNAIYGFLNILLKYRDLEEPDGICVAFDLPGGTFRHEFFGEYKAQRKGMPDELAAQLQPVKDILSAMGIEIFEAKGFEADDVIGTFSKRCEEALSQCVILTGDKDDLQLASNLTKIKLVRTVSGKTQDDDFDINKLYEVYGMSPQQFIDLKAIMGDKSDNIPGVPGIGEKGAMDLIHKFGSLDGIYENIESDKIKTGTRNKLMENRQMAYDSRFLSEIKRDVPIETDFDKILNSKADEEKLSALLSDFELSSLMSKFNIEKKTVSKEISILSDISSLRGKKTAYVYDNNVLTLYDGEQLYKAEDTEGFFKDSEIEKITFDVKSDIVSGLNPENVIFDVSLGAYVCDQSIAPITKEKVYARYGGNFDDEAVILYNCYTEILAIIEKQNQKELYYTIELPLAYVLADMELTGVNVDIEVLKELSDKYKQEISDLEGEIYDLAGCEFNINSPKQLGEILYNRLMLPALKKNKRGMSTDAETLEKLEPYHPIIRKILDYRSISKLNSTYIEGMKVLIAKDGRLHTNYNQSATQTGRLSSAEPNLQNIPIRTRRGKEIRRMFTAGEGYILLDADYSQIELRVISHMSGEQNMIDAFLSGEDIHTQTASHIFSTSIENVTPEMRSSAKAVNFGIIYGIGEFSLAKNIGVSRGEAKRYIESYKGKYPNLVGFMEDTVEKAKAEGYVETVFGRRRYIPELSASNFVTRSFGERAAMNAPVQGTAADIMKLAMINVYKKLKGKKSRLIMQVHDELVLETTQDELSEVSEILKYEMENAVNFSLPLTVEMNSGNSLYDTK